MPGKVLMSIGRQSMLSFMLTRLKRARLLDGIVVATTEQSPDDAIVAEVEKMGWVHTVRGSENDVLSRYLLAIDEVSADVVVRMTSDCPLIDPILVDRMINIQRENRSDYVSTNVTRTGFPRGMDTEVTPAENLRIANREATDPYDREHVMPFLYRHPERFTCLFPMAPQRLNRPQYRLCVDEKEDLELVRAIIAALGENKKWGLEQIVTYLDQNPWVVFINRRVEQKPEYL
jgi:spore coat polysaccharide biosynthesis protein SpsF